MANDILEGNRRRGKPRQAPGVRDLVHAVEGALADLAVAVTRRPA